MCEKVTKECTKCQTEKNYRTNKKTNFKSLHTKETGKNICTDIYGPISIEFRGDENHKYVLVFSDRHSRYTKLVLMKDIESRTVCSAITKKWIYQEGKPIDILTDQGKQFMSQRFKTLCQSNNIVHRTTTAYYPQGNGLCERINQMISQGLRLQRGKPLRKAIHNISRAYNTTYHRSIGTTPKLAHTTRQNISPETKMKIQLAVDSNVERNRESRQNNNKETIFDIGQKVWLRILPPPSKLEPKWKDHIL